MCLGGFHVKVIVFIDINIIIKGVWGILIRRFSEEVSVLTEFY